MTEQSFKELYPFESRYHEIGGLRQHYLDEGAGSAVVMLHGNPTWSFFYRELVKFLRDDFRCVAPDHIGMGFSDKPQNYSYRLADHIANLENLLAAVLAPDEKISLVVHDWGGAIGMGWAARHPERVDKLVILNTAAFRSVHMPLRIAACRIPVFGEAAVRGFNAFAACATRMTTVRPLPAEVKQGFLLPYDSWKNRIATHRFVLDIPMKEAHPSWQALVEVEQGLERFRDTPMLIQWGARDWCFDLTFFEEWKQRFPAAQSDCYADAGHYLLEDAGDRILPRVKEFLSC